MTKTNDDNFAGIEETQAALRESIEKAKALTRESDRRIRRRRDEGPEAEGPEAEPPNPA